jgi:hypothetical protein
MVSAAKPRPKENVVRQPPGSGRTNMSHLFAANAQLMETSLSTRCEAVLNRRFAATIGPTEAVLLERLQLQELH